MGARTQDPNPWRQSGVPQSATSITSENPARMPLAGASANVWQATYARGLALSDLVAVIAAVGIAQFVRFGSASSNPTAPLLHDITYIEISIAIAIEISM